jgi:K+/H+ antiporter YhaU regulatory subunit KhtT
MKLFTTVTLVSIFLFLSNSISAQEIEIPASELEKFILVQQKIDQKNEQIQQEMIAAIEKHDFTLERFNEIYESKSNPEVVIEITEKEAANFDQVMSTIQTIQVGFQEEAMEILRDHSMSQEDYQKVYVAIQSNPELQQKYLELINN